MFRPLFDLLLLKSSHHRRRHPIEGSDHPPPPPRPHSTAPPPKPPPPRPAPPSRWQRASPPPSLSREAPAAFNGARKRTHLLLDREAIDEPLNATGRAAPKEVYVAGAARRGGRRDRGRCPAAASAAPAAASAAASKHVPAAVSPVPLPDPGGVPSERGGRPAPPCG